MPTGLPVRISRDQATSFAKWRKNDGLWLPFVEIRRRLHPSILPFSDVKTAQTSYTTGQNS